MRHLLSYFLFCLILCGCGMLLTQKSRMRIIEDRSWESARYIDAPGGLYRNKDFSKNVYLVDSIHIHMNSYKIISSDKTHLTFVVTNEVWENKHFSERKVLENPSCYILNNIYSICYFDFALYPWFESIKQLSKLEGPSYGPSSQFPLQTDSLSDVKASYTSCHFIEPPSFYYLLLYRGDFYNQMLHCSTEGYKYHSWLDFPDLMGYYKVLIPVWK